MEKIMKEQLITFETAKLAKEKGFDIPHRGYNHIGKLQASWNLEIERYHTVMYYFAPPQSVLQKWLRENHKLFISIIYHKSTKHSIILNDDCENTVGDCFGEYFNTYEEALEFALQEALKLI